ncbi:MAG TPA: hypothetical protein VEI02_15860 [Planctomycetota bacterium]|nr:hypothetical protein [Planctomycetota bacterium]
MGEKYVVFLPTDPHLLPSEDRIRAALAALRERGVIAGDPARPETWRNGANAGILFRDTDPRKTADGRGDAEGKLVFSTYVGETAGFAGDNLEPVACIYCNSELPYDCAQDAFWGRRDGKALDDPCMTMECYHCARGNSALEADWGRSGGFARLAFKFEGELSNRVEAVPEGMALLSEALGTPVRFVQVHGW